MMFMICEETLGAQIHFIQNKISYELRDFRIFVFESDKISRILSFSQKQVYVRIVHSRTATYPKESVNGSVTVKIAPKSTTNVIFPFHGIKENHRKSSRCRLLRTLMDHNFVVPRSLDIIFGCGVSPDALLSIAGRHFTIQALSSARHPKNFANPPLSLNLKLPSSYNYNM